MKKFSLTKIVSFALVCAMLVGAFMFTTVSAEDAGTTLEIVSQNVYFDEKLELMFAFNAPAEPTSVTASVNGAPVDVVLYEENPTQDGVKVADYAYKVVQGVVPHAIDTVVTFTVTCDGNTVSKDYSVLQYIYERMYVSANKAEGAELEMLQALLAYADASNAFLNNATVSFSDYKYVTVVGGTIDGNNVSGMFLPGATPFENIAANIVLEEGQGIEWSVSVNGGEAVVKSFDEVKALEITGNTVVTANAVAATCEHVWVGATCTEAATCQLCGVTGEANGHDWQNNATCTTAETCANCDATGTPALGHTTPNAEGKCDRCGEALIKTYTVSKSHTDIATIAGVTAGQNSGNIGDKKISLDENISITCAKGTSTSVPCIYSESIRLYQNGATMTISAENNAQMKTIVITLATKSGGQGPISVTGGTASELSNNKYTITVNEGVTSVVITTTGTSSSARLYVANIEVVYDK